MWEPPGPPRPRTEPHWGEERPAGLARVPVGPGQAWGPQFSRTLLQTPEEKPPALPRLRH